MSHQMPSSRPRRRARRPTAGVSLAAALLLATLAAPATTSSATGRDSEPAAHAAAAGSSTAWWPQFRYGPLQRGSQPYETVISPTTAPGLRLAWRVPVSAPPVTPDTGMTLAFGHVMAASNDGYVTALDPATGELQWRTRVSTTFVQTAPAITAGTTVVQDNAGMVIALDTATGTIRWRRLVRGGLSSPTVVDDDVLVGGGELVWSLSVATGAVRWKRRVGLIRSAVAVAGERVVAASQDSTAYAFDRTTGRLLWRTALPCLVRDSSPAVAAGRVFFGSVNWRCGAMALRLRTGRVLWHARLPEFADTSVAADGTRVYVNVAGAKETVEALDLASGRRLWSATGGGHGSVSLANGVVFAPGVQLRAFEAATGQLLWTSERVDFFGSPTIADGTVYAAGNGDVVAYRLANDARGRHR